MRVITCCEFYTYRVADFLKQYDMYLDDGVSRASAPKSSFMGTNDARTDLPAALVADPEAQSVYRHVRIKHVS